MEHAVEAVQQFFDDAVHEARTREVEYEVEQMRGLVLAYMDYYRNDPLRTVAVERPYELPLLNRDTGKQVGETTYGGIVDWIAEKDGLLYFGDHKTAAKVDAGYWQELATNPQLTQYWMAAEQMDIPLKGFIWDVVVKPSGGPIKIRGKTIKKQIIKDLEDGVWCGVPYPHRDWENSDVETPRMLGIRTFLNVSNNANKHFFRRELRRTADDVWEWLADLKTVAERMGACVEEKDALKNRTFCKSFNSFCEFHDICAGYDPDRINYRKRGEGVIPDPNAKPSPFSKNSISISSLNEFNNCERKWYYRKVDKIERIREQPRALFKGDLFHKALELWLSGRPSTMTVDFKGCVCNECKET